MSTQLNLFPPQLLETQSQKLIRAFAEGDKMPQAKRLFALEMMQCLRRSGGNTDDPVVQRMATFGRKILGEEAESVFQECVNLLVDEMERSQEAVV